MRSKFGHSVNGILFSPDAIRQLSPRILTLNRETGFDSVLELMSILHDLSISHNQRALSERSFQKAQVSYYRRQIEMAIEHMNNNCDKPVSLTDIAKLKSIMEAPFGHFIKKCIGSSFIDSLNEIRLGHACRMLMNTWYSVAAISYKCGFNNISNVNYIFKKKKGKIFREPF